MNKAVFLDRDGTINVDHGYVYEKEKFELIDRVPESLKLLQGNGFKLIIVTNQSGIARGYYSEADFEALNSYMMQLLADMGVSIDAVYHCPHLKGCECRKPKLKLFYEAQKDFDLDFSRSYAIGDNIRDLAICEAESVKGVLLGADSQFNERFSICRDLFEAAKLIVQSST